MVRRSQSRGGSVRATLALWASAGLFACQFASGETIAFEDFQAGASGWTNNTTEFTPALSRFLGRHTLPPGASGTVSKSFPLSGLQTQVTVEFDFYEIDSWDGERFQVFANGTQVVNGQFWVQPNFTSTDMPGVLPGVTEPGSAGGAVGSRTSDLGFNTFNDQRWHYTLVLNTTAPSLKLAFGSTLDQHVTDEAWGVDNLSIVDNVSAVPLPPAAWGGLALFGLTAADQWRRKRTGVAES